MIITDIEKKFLKIKSNSEYIRVSDDHPLELYIGLNEKGMKTLRFNGIFSVVKLVGNNILEIKQIKTTKYNSLLFSFNGNDGITIFYKFCEDLINQTANYKGESPYSEIVNRYKPDGINLDYIRYPQSLSPNYSNYDMSNWGYTQYARADFKETYGVDPMDIKPYDYLWDYWRYYRCNKII